MPTSTPPPGQRGGRLLVVLFWCGVGLAPAAAATLLLSPAGGPFRLTALLVVTSMVLIGLSIVLRPDPETAYAELSEELEAARYEAAQADEAARRAIVSARTEIRDLKFTIDDLTTRLGGRAGEAEPAPPPPPRRGEDRRSRHAAEAEKTEEFADDSLARSTQDILARSAAPVSGGASMISLAPDPSAAAPSNRRTRAAARREAESTGEQQSGEGWMSSVQGGGSYAAAPEPSSYDGRSSYGDQGYSRYGAPEPADHPHGAAWRTEEREPEAAPVSGGRRAAREPYDAPYQEAQSYELQDFSVRRDPYDYSASSAGSGYDDAAPGRARYGEPYAEQGYEHRRY